MNLFGYMHHIYVSLEFALSLEGHIALIPTLLVGTTKVRSIEVDFERLIIVVEHISVLIATEVTRQMHTVEVLSKDDIVEEEFFAKVTPRMWQDLGSLITCRVTVFDMITQLLNMVDALLADEHCATLETNKAECLLMCFFHVAPQAFIIREMLFRRTITN